MSITEDDIRRERVRQILMQGAAAPPQPEVTPPSQAMVPPDLSSYQQAAALEQQAAPPPDPYAGMSTGKQMLMRGLAGAAGGAIHAQDEGGYTGYLQQQHLNERQREQDLLGRAKELRGEGYTRERDFAGDQRLQQARELQQQQFASEDDYRRAQIEKIRQQEGFTLNPGQTRFGANGEPVANVPASERPDTSVSPTELFMQDPAKYSEMLKVQAQLKPPAAASQRNIDPLSPEGIKARLEFEKQKPKAEATTVSSPYAAERAARTVQSVDELLGQVSGWTVGTGSLLAKIPGTQARTFKSQLDTLKANIAFNELAQMRAASKTGGALGQISDREEQLLSSTLGGLDVGQSPADLKTQLQKVKDSILRWQSAQAGTPGQSPTAAGQKLKRTNNRTGEVQFSDDGGKTWHK